MDYATHDNAAGDARALLDFVAVAIPAEMFTARMAVTRKEEDMSVNAPSTPPHLISVFPTLRSLIIGAHVTIFSLPRFMNNYFFISPLRPLARVARSSPFEMAHPTPFDLLQPTLFPS